MKSPNTVKIRAAEGTLAYHSVYHHMSFNSLDCTVAVDKKIFSDSDIAKQITCNRTKATSIITNVLAPFSTERILKELESVSFISVPTDASNHGSIQLFPILIQYFNHNETGITTKIVNIVTAKNEIFRYDQQIDC